MSVRDICLAKIDECQLDVHSVIEISKGNDSRLEVISKLNANDGRCSVQKNSQHISWALIGAKT